MTTSELRAVSKPVQASGWQFWVDRGGTFTDIVARAPDGALSTHKLLSENPERYSDAVVQGIRDVLGLAADAPIEAGLVDAVKIGTTVATNALLERKGMPTLLVVDHGFADVLRIGDQTRSALFGLDVPPRTTLHADVIEVGGRVAVDGTTLAPLDEAATRAALNAAYARGLRACAIALLHSWKFPETEQRVAALARAAGFVQVSMSHEVSPLLKLVPRGDTTVADAYLSPVLGRYVERLADSMSGIPLAFMQSNGGLAAADQFRGKDAVLSGPAGGIVGAARTAAIAGLDHIIGFDMGGTSTDVALYAGAFERTFESKINGVHIRAPMMAINTVAAGGGSILHFDGLRFQAGPDSAGAFPGPACYRNGGPLTITDANVCVGKLQPHHFPAIFGPNGNQPLDAATVEAGFATLADDIAAATGQRREPRDVAEGFLRIAVANMAHAIKQISVQKGHDVTRFALQCFGGAGGQHACLVADELQMDTILIHPFAGVLSAYGIGLADRTAMREQAIEIALGPDAVPQLSDALDALAEQALAELRVKDGERSRVVTLRRVHIRYQGTDTALMVPFEPAAESLTTAFEAAHRTRFGFITPGRPLIAETVSVEVTVGGETAAEQPLPRRASGAPETVDRVPVWSGGAAHDAPVFDRPALRFGDRIEGPALIREANATTMVEPGWAAEVSEFGHLVMRRHAARQVAGADAAAGAPDPVLLEFFNNLFRSIADQSGLILQNTALSVNIRERLDFSCAIFDGEGRLVANAQHIPVHLGAMGESVRTILRNRRETLKPGDVLVLNNPFNGGTHLPDVTVIAPVFDEAGKQIRFFTASRGHHVDIGGITPGSTPPLSRTLEEEGVVIDDFLLVDGGTFREDAFRALLNSGRYPARNPEVNIADVRAQIASNETSARELAKVVAHYGWPTVSAYMGHVMDNAEENIRRVIDRLSDGRFTYAMDDGAKIEVAVSIDHAARTATVDFTGTSAQRETNFNAPRAVTAAAVLYVFRCLVDQDIPLNDGCLKPITIKVPEGSFLDPRPGAAVVAGNTEVSQALCNALFGALGVLACSQGTMNNFLFGDATRQYYETICGGTGAGPGFNGASAVQTHMTNTRMTDPEIFELRYPVRLEEFSVRTGSGGDGAFRGGDGVVRRVRFLEPMTAVLVSSRRAAGPFGLAGGGDGLPGRQWVERANGKREILGGRAQAELQPGDMFVIETPGGGGFGKPAAAMREDTVKAAVNG